MSKDKSFSTAIHILTALAYRQGELLSSEELAMSLQTNPGLIRRTLTKLAKTGLIQTSKGKYGGSSLAKTPQEISLKAVYQSVKTDDLFSGFSKPPFPHCPVSQNMGAILEDVYAELETHLFIKMEQMMLADMVKKVPKKQVSAKPRK